MSKGATISAILFSSHPSSSLPGQRKYNVNSRTILSRLKVSRKRRSQAGRNATNASLPIGGGRLSRGIGPWVRVRPTAFQEVPAGGRFHHHTRHGLKRVHET